MSVSGALASMLLLLAWGVDTSMAEEVRGPSRPSIDIAYSASLFYNVDANDALAATSIWVKSILHEKMEDAIALSTFIVQDGSQLIQAYRAGKIDLLVTSPLEYLAVADSIDLQPVLVGASEVGPLDEFILLVHASAGIDNLQMLEGKRLIMEVAARGELPGMWLDILLAMNHLPPAEEYLRSVRRVDKTGQALLPVFFAQTDACIVTRRAFELMVELNPQIGEATAELYSSPGYCRSLLCLRPDIYQEHRGLLEESLLALHRQTRGRQILRLFHLDRLIPFEPKHLDAAASLVITHRDLLLERDLWKN